jgi:hypothetical protein
MKKILASVVASLAIGSASYAQTFNMFVETGTLSNAEGQTISKSDTLGFSILAAPYAVSTQDADNFFAGLSSNLFDAEGNVETGIGDLKSFLSGLTWTPLVASGNENLDFQAMGVSTNQGSRPLLVMFDAADIESIAPGTQIGLVGGTSLAGSFGNTNYAFNAGVNSLSEEYLGTLGSLQAATIVPEPSSFALLAGVFGFAWVMVRRRK